MKPVYVFLSIVLTILICFSPAICQDQLEEFEDEVKSTPSASSERDEGDEDSVFWEAFFDLLYILNASDGGSGIRKVGPALKGLFTGAWPNDWENHNPHFWTAAYAPYPYHSPRKGLFINTQGRKHAIGVMGHYLHSDNSLSSYSVRSRFSPSPFYSIEAHVSGFKETRQTSNDYLAFYDLYFNYQRVRSEKAMFWYGVGIKGMQREGEYYGPAANMGLEIYPGKPMSFSGLVNIGRLNSRSVWESMFRMNLHLNRTMVFLGYQRFSVGSVAIGGVIGGLGLFF